MAFQLEVVGEFRSKGAKGAPEFVPIHQVVEPVGLPGAPGDLAPPSPAAEALGYLTAGLEGEAVVLALVDDGGGIWVLTPGTFPDHLEGCAYHVHAASGLPGAPSLLVGLGPEAWERWEGETCDLFAGAVRQALGPTGFLPVFVASADGSRVNWWELDPWAEGDGGEEEGDGTA